MAHPVHNVHVRILDAPAASAGAVIDSLSSPDDRFWPTLTWPPLRFDRPLQVGAVGGHGPIPYSVIEYEPGRRVRCQFAPGVGINGWHELRVEALPDDRCRLVHEATAAPSGSMRLAWPLVVRWLHDALIEDAMDNAERYTTGRVRTPARWSPWVRLLRAVVSARPRSSVRLANPTGLTRFRPRARRP